MQIITVDWGWWSMNLLYLWFGLLFGYLLAPSKRN